MRILVSGSGGMIGTALCERLRQSGHEVSRLVRRPARDADEWSWAPQHGEIPDAAIDAADAVVSLNGASLSALPWTTSYRDEIVTSRVTTAGTIAQAIARSAHPPQVWASASAVGFYGRTPGADPLDESAPKGEGFLADTVSAWEIATRPAEEASRIVRLRTGIVLGPSGALRPLALASRFGLGTTFGTGMQHWPWVSLDDEVRAIMHVIGADDRSASADDADRTSAANPTSISGPVNIAAPVRNTAAEVARAVSTALSRPHRLRMPTPAAHLLLGTAGDEMLLADQPAVPQALLDDGFRFATTGLADAVTAALNVLPIDVVDAVDE